MAARERSTGATVCAAESHEDHSNHGPDCDHGAATHTAGGDHGSETEVADHGSYCSHDHGHSHSHGAIGHSHFSHADTAQKLAFSLGLTLLILAAEVVGGLLSHSLALLSDAAHMVTDVASLGLAWYAQWQAGRPATHRRTYGYHRAGIMAALVNAVTLIGVSVLIGWEAWNRIQHPVAHISAHIMFGVAAAALVLNLGIARLLQHDMGANLNVRSALLHVLGDAAASAGVIVGGIILLFQPDWTMVDPVLSLLIALVIVWGAWQILQETTNVLMEGTPTGIDARDLEASLMAVPGVQDVHHVHIWSLCPGMNALSGHVVIEDQALSQAEGIRAGILTLLRGRYQVDHATIQFEHQECGVFCPLQPDQAAR